MEYRDILDRIVSAVDAEAYFTPVHRIQGPEAEALALFRAAMKPGFDPELVRSLVIGLHSEGRLRRVTALSALHIIAAHPAVARWDEAARLAGEQELAALEEGGPDLAANLASADRHRGVIAYLRGHLEVALDYFARALERERSAENLGNILCTLIRLGEEDDAAALLEQVRRSYPAPMVAELDQLVETDPDLALLREENRP